MKKNKIWCTDFTYMRQPNGKFRYNCTIMDLFDRSAIASVNSDYINTELAIETLTEALKKRKTQQWNTSAQRSGSTIYILGVCQFLQG